MVDWQEISQQYGPLVWRTAYRLLGSDADAADCFQETFLSALGISRRQQVQNWAALLQHLATARALDCLRRRKREVTRFPEPPNWELVPSTYLGPERLAQDSELLQALRSALTQLPAQQSEVFCLRHLNNLKYEEIADELGISVDGVGMALHRARGRLRELLVWACPVQREKR